MITEPLIPNAQILPKNFTQVNVKVLGKYIRSVHRLENILKVKIRIIIKSESTN